MSDSKSEDDSGTFEPTPEVQVIGNRGHIVLKHSGDDDRYRLQCTMCGTYCESNSVEKVTHMTARHYLTEHTDGIRRLYHDNQGAQRTT